VRLRHRVDERHTGLPLPNDGLVDDEPHKDICSLRCEERISESRVNVAGPTPHGQGIQIPFLAVSRDA